MFLFKSTISKDELNNLTSSMAEYNSNTNDWVQAIAHSMIPIALAILGVCFLVEFTKTSERFRETQGTPIDSEIIMQMALKYVLTFLAIMLASQIIDAVLWVTNVIGKNVATTGGLSGHNGPEENALFQASKVKMNWAQKPLFYTIFALHTCAFVGIGLLAKILIFLRFITLCIFKAISPIIVSLGMTTDFKSVVINFWKQIMAISLQSVVLIIVLKLYPMFLSDDSLSGTVTFGEWVPVAMGAFLKLIAVVFVIIGSQNLSRRLLGV
ncbi:hypothetical protein [Fructobacillus evanidus]|uniref:Conjugation protein n=1 Tax=Fructobacillus evanidus TaxID=3064281 RepID=A0ABN9YX32_9LACO|nr:hypothetical protein R54837_OMAIDLJD_00325 [Fructobacillus sp. LMG 32999]CAK1246567.1 hypothetical protein R55214_HHFBAMCI_01080 [Fructobacillus sp. LMG 32999]